MFHLKQAFYDQAKNLFVQGDRVLLAVSGGVDSMVLLDLFLTLQKDLGINQLGVIHVNHQLRSISLAEEMSLESIVEAYRLPFYKKRWPKQNHQDSHIEVSARDFRYKFFEETMNKEGYNKLVTAHHADDQVETILMRLVRGNHFSNLAGIEVKRQFGPGDLVRPLLNIFKVDIRSYAEEKKLLYFEDETNSLLEQSRNRYRNQIIPLLEEENAQAKIHILNFKNGLVKREALLESYINESLKKVIAWNDEGFKLNQEAWDKLSPLVKEEISSKLLVKLYDNKKVDLSKSLCKNLVSILDHQGEEVELHLPQGWRLTKSYSKFILSKQDIQLGKLDNKKCTLTLNSWLYLGNQQLLGLFDRDHIDNLLTNEAIIFYLDLEDKQLPLIVRHRQDGDTISFHGMKGQKKVSRYFIDAKIPRDEREKSWLLVDQQSEVLAILGYRTSKNLSQEDQGQAYILVDLKKEKI